MAVRLASHDITKVESMTNLLRLSPQTSVVTSEGMSLNVSTNLLSIYSSILSPLLSMHSCLSSTILLPDFTLLTLSNLVELLSKGYSKQCSDDLEVQNLLDIGEVLGIDLDSLYLGSREDSNKLFQVKQECNKEEEETVEVEENIHEIVERADSLGGKVKEIVRKREIIDAEISEAEDGPSLSQVDKGLEESIADHELERNQIKAMDSLKNENFPVNYKCEMCGKVCLSLSLLGYHYCKHFSREISNLDLDVGGTTLDNSCIECDQKFYDRNTLLAHLGVKHEFVNTVLQMKGIPVLPLPKLRKKKSTSKNVLDNESLTGRGNQSPGAKNASIHTATEENINIKVSDVKTESNDELQIQVKVSDELCTEASTDIDSEGVKCPQCPKQYASLSKLKQHLCWHFRGELKNVAEGIMNGNTCGMCNETLKNRSALLMHIGTIHGKLNEVLEMKGLPKLVKTVRSYKTKDSLKHATTKHEETFDVATESAEKDVAAPLFDGCTCLVCGKIFEDKDKTVEHVEYRHGKLKEDFEESSKPKKVGTKRSQEVKFCTSCEVCSKEFDSVSHLTQHMVRIHFWKEVREKFTHLYDKNTCLLCSKSFSQQNSTILHVGSMHRKIDEIMEEKGLRPLTNDVMNITKIKAELEEAKEHCESIPSGSLE